MEQDCVLAGYSKLVVWVSSTHSDMDIHVGLRVLDENDREVDYCGPALIPGIGTKFYPLAKGWLKVSHRKLDQARSTEFRPKHTHLHADHAPLTAGEIVRVEVEIVPTTGVVAKATASGWTSSRTPASATAPDTLTTAHITTGPATPSTPGPTTPVPPAAGHPATGIVKLR